MAKRRNERLYMAMIGPLKKIVSASCVTEVAGALVELPCPCPGSSFVNKLKHFRGIATRYEQTRQKFSRRSPVGRLSSCSTEDRPYSGGATLDPVMPKRNRRVTAPIGLERAKHTPDLSLKARPSHPVPWRRAELVTLSDAGGFFLWGCQGKGGPTLRAAPFQSGRGSVVNRRLVRQILQGSVSAYPSDERRTPARPTSSS